METEYYSKEKDYTNNQYEKENRSINVGKTNKLKISDIDVHSNDMLSPTDVRKVIIMMMQKSSPPLSNVLFRCLLDFKNVYPHIEE